LSHPARISILQILAEKKEIKTANISDFLPIGRTTVSRHLKELKQAGIIEGNIDGLRIHYCLNSTFIKESNKILLAFLKQLEVKNDCNCND
jgi:ArsR family transcriptional regulator